MANLIELIHTNRQPMVRTDVSADYCFNRAYFQIRTYRNGDTRRTEGQTQKHQPRTSTKSILSLICIINSCIFCTIGLLSVIII